MGVYFTWLLAFRENLQVLDKGVELIYGILSYFIHDQAWVMRLLADAMEGTESMLGNVQAQFRCLRENMFQFLDYTYRCQLVHLEPIW